MGRKFLVLCLLSTLFVFTFTFFTLSAEKSDSDRKKSAGSAVAVRRGNINTQAGSHSSAKPAKTPVSSAVVPSPVIGPKAPPPGTSFNKGAVPTNRPADTTTSTKKQKVEWKPATDRKLVKEFKKPEKSKPSTPVLSFRNYHAASRETKSPGSNFKNGGFELDSASLANWTALDLSGSGGWFLQTGTFTPLTGFIVSSPPEGLHAAMTDMTGPGTHILYQDFVVPPSAVLSFDFYVQNQAAVWAVPVPETLDFNVAPNQHIRADIMDPSAPADDVGSGVLMNIFLTHGSDPFEFGYVTATADLSAFAGQTVRLRFAGVETEFFQFFGVDNVRLSSGAIGLVADYATNSVVAFDPKTDTVLTSIPIANNCGGIVGGVAISPDGTLGFVTNFCGQVYVIDLTVTPPVLASGTNPITVSQAAEGVVVTPDGRYLLVSNPNVSVVDIESRTEIGTNPVAARDVTVCSDNSVLTGEFFDGNVHRLTIDSSGVLTDTGEVLAANSPMNVSCVPGNATGLVPSFGDNSVRSFAIPGLAQTDLEGLATSGQTAITNRAGTKAYVRHSDCFNPHVDYFNYDFTTGAMTALGITINLANIPASDCWFGIDQLALYGNKLYVSANGAVEIYNATNGAFIGSITDASISNPTGIAIYLPPATGTGLVADTATNSVVVFDPGTDTITGVVPIPSGGLVGDVEVSRDGTLGFVTNFGNQVYVIDLKQTPPRLASGTNPIAMSQPGEDLALTPDGQFLLSCDGGGNTIISVIDIANRTESSTFTSPCNGIQVCADNSVLTSADGVGSHRLTIDGSGTIIDTGETIAAGLINPGCGRAGITGLALNYGAPFITSYAIPGLGQIDQEPLALFAGQTAISNRNGNQLYVRTTDCGSTSQVDLFDYDFLTGQMTPTGVSLPLAPLSDCWYGIDQLALYGNKLYASAANSLSVFDVTTGSMIASITDSAISYPTGVTVHIPNSRPNAADDSYNTDLNVQLDVLAPGVLTNDSDANGDLILAVLDGGPASGSLTLNPDGSFSYLPNNGFSGDDSFQYHATDGLENSNIGTVNIHVNAAPVAADDNYSTNKNITLNVSAPGVLGNDSDEGAITAELDSGTSNGTLTLNSDGSFTYIPDGGFSGNDSFTYHANDGSLDSNIATVNITVINSVPVAADDNYNTARNGQLTVGAPGVLSNDSDADGDSLNAVKDTDPPNGTVTLNADGSFTYTPDTGFVGIDTFTYHANDGTANSNIATVNITVTNDAPIATDDSYVTDKNIALNVPAPGVLGNDSDPNGDPLTAVVDVNPTNGSLTLNADGSFTYTPNTDYVGADSFTYHANDGADDSNIATVNLTVNQTCLFCDDFNDGTIDPNWTYVKPTWTEGGGNLMGTPVKKRATAAATPVFAGCQMCSMEASMQTAGGISNKLWLLGWYVDRKNTMELLMKEENERWVLKQRVNGRVVAKAKGIKTIDTNTAYAARIVFDGTSFQVFVDDFVTPLFTLTPQGSVPTGTVGFSVKNTTGSFDYVTVN
jgi:VCBS repeat-containing protein